MRNILGIAEPAVLKAQRASISSSQPVLLDGDEEPGTGEDGGRMRPLPDSCPGVGSSTMVPTLGDPD